MKVGSFLNSNEAHILYAAIFISEGKGKCKIFSINGNADSDLHF
jgi:hypothetical protein